MKHQYKSVNLNPYKPLGLNMPLLQLLALIAVIATVAILIHEYL